ncbi:MAG: hemin-degrading factor, partial [Chloracidobacterium sp.]|nr:hemin-degrading factor [Chloracidobacterium sp.]
SVLFQGECGESSDAAQVDHVDVAALLQAWGAMTDTHEFFDLLKRFGVSRKQAMQLARGRYTRQVGNNSVQLLLEAASFEQVPIMVFVGNPGCIQIHTGPVRQIHVAQYQGNTWVNVLDADFNFHLLQDKVRECWVVEKPTRDGVVTSLEVFDDKGRAVAMLFGARKPGQPELASWRVLLQDLPT